jgi:hypothetical protein
MRSEGTWSMFSKKTYLYLQGTNQDWLLYAEESPRKTDPLIEIAP